MPVIETNGTRRPMAPSGVYRHPQTGQELIAVATSKFGNPQADAYERLGYQYVGPAKKELTESQVDPHAQPEVANVGVKTAAQLRAELAEAEAREAAGRENLKASGGSTLVADEEDDDQPASAEPSEKEAPASPAPSKSETNKKEAK